MSNPERDDLAKQLEEIVQARGAIERELASAIVGQKLVVEQVVAALFSRGHCLLVGVPGLAKTAMVRALASIFSLKFKRIQFTPDLMPSDITGTEVLEESESKRRAFRFIEGPIFANIILADEINRTPPKTQAALLEAMQERQVTVGTTTYALPDPLLVIATQNPIEQGGTDRLPEAQLDRFMFCIHVDYPAFEEEEEILQLTSKEQQTQPKAVITQEQILRIQRLARKVIFSRSIVRYIVKLVRATRPGSPDAPAFVKELVEWGAGPRAGQFLLQGARSMAALDGRSWVSFDDVAKVAVPVLRHRMATNFKAKAEGIDTVKLVGKLLGAIPTESDPRYQ